MQQGADGPHAQVGGARVDRHQPQDVPALFRLPQDLVALDHEDGRAALAHQRALEQHLGPLAERRLQIGLVVPDGQDAARCRRSPGPPAPSPAAGRSPGMAHESTRPRSVTSAPTPSSATPPDARRRLVPEGQMQQQVADRRRCPARAAGARWPCPHRAGSPPAGRSRAGSRLRLEVAARRSGRARRALSAGLVGDDGPAPRRGSAGTPLVASLIPG